MASERINTLKVLWNEIESQRAVEWAWRLGKKDHSIKNMAEAWHNFGKFVQAMISAEISKTEPYLTINIIEPSGEGVPDGYYGYRIEGVHQGLYRQAKHMQHNNALDTVGEKWTHILRNETK